MLFFVDSNQLDHKPDYERSRVLDAEATPGIDLGPILLDDLRRAASSKESLCSAIGLLDVLATRAATGSSAFDEPVVYVGDEADARVRARIRGHVPRHEQAGVHRAWLLRDHCHDTTVGGHRVEGIYGVLTFTATSWSYTRDVLWSEDDPGIEKS